MQTKIAFVGFRHGHIYGLLALAKERDDMEIVACCEEHEATRNAVVEAGHAEIAYDDHLKMLDEVECDVVAIGDYYARRGSLIIDAMDRGKHTVTDKPICTRLDELDRIETLAKEKDLVVGCMLDLRDTVNFNTMRQAILAGEIGEVLAISFNGQHPLNFGTRDSWYFEEGKQGGTINDIAIHGIDAIPWMTGRRIVRIDAARTWHVNPAEAPYFNDGAQMMLTLDNGGGVLGDVSYFAPNSQGYSIPQYWRTTIWGSRGVIECNSATADTVTLYRDGEKEGRALPLHAGCHGGYLDAFLKEIRGQKEGLHLSSAEVLASAGLTLTIQHAADNALTNIQV